MHTVSSATFLIFDVYTWGLDRPPSPTHIHLRGEIGRSGGVTGLNHPCRVTDREIYHSKTEHRSYQSEMEKDGVQPSIHVWESTFSPKYLMPSIFFSFLCLSTANKKTEDSEPNDSKHSSNLISS
jgi:hypothetical protein